MAEGTPNPWTTESGIKALRVPGHTQPDSEAECLLYAIWMVLQYISTVYPSTSVRENVDVIKPEVMKDAITIRESGWSPDQSDLDNLSELTEPVNWELKKWLGPPPANTFDSIIQRNLESALPVIAVVDAFRIQGRQEPGPLHALVVTGMGDKRVVVNDPWGRMYDVYKRDTMVDAWDAPLNRMITVDLSEQSTIQTHIEEDENNG